MSLRTTALKPGELRPLSRTGLLLVAARCALRVETWLPGPPTAHWKDTLAGVVAAAFALPAKHASTRTLSDWGASACNRLKATNEPLGRCMNYATQTLVTAVEATSLAERPALVKAVIDTAKLSASITAIWAHAGRTTPDTLDTVCATTWTAIRSDVALLILGHDDVESAKNQVGALRKLGPLWPKPTPSWASP